MPIPEVADGFTGSVTRLALGAGPANILHRGGHRLHGDGSQDADHYDDHQHLDQAEPGRCVTTAVHVQFPDQSVSGIKISVYASCPGLTITFRLIVSAGGR